jgi:membrane fusion protein (multidrug efflux system)
MQTMHWEFGLFAESLLRRLCAVGARCVFAAFAAEESSSEKSDSEESKEKEKSEDTSSVDDEEKSSDDKKKKEEKKDGEEKKDKDEKPKGPPPYKRPAFIIIVSAVLLVAIIGGLLYWLHARHFVSTDDAYIDGHVVQIAPQVPAPVIALHVDDNQLVHKGDLLVELDPTDYEVAVEQSKAQVAVSQGRLAQQQAQLDAAKASVAQAAAEVDAAQVSLDNATADLQRYQTVDERARSRQQLDNAIATQKNAQAQLEQAKARKVSAEANVSTAAASIQAAEGDTRVSEANLKRSQVNLGYCRIYSPADGRVTQRTVEVGNYVQTGASMFMLVSPDIWVTANFKETQLKHMQPGQPVTIKVDAFSDRELHGHVDSIQAGSGSRFGVLPAENATGNFVKIVQRVPVKIIFDFGSNTNDAGLLSPGLSVIPKVKVR